MDGVMNKDKPVRACANAGKSVKCPVLLLWLFLLTFFSQFGLGIAQIISSVTFLPTGPLTLRMEESKTVMMEVVFYRSKLPSKPFNLSLTGRADNPRLANLHSQSMVVDPSGSDEQSNSDNDSDADAASAAQSLVPRGGIYPVQIISDEAASVNASFIVSGTFLGITDVTVWLSVETDENYESQTQSLNSNQNSKAIDEIEEAPDGVTKSVAAIERLSQPGRPMFGAPDSKGASELVRFPIRVFRSARAKKLNAIFVSTLGCLIILANVMMGCQLNLKTVAEVLKRPIAPAIGFFCQFAIMPAVAYGLARTIMLPAGLFSLGLGLFTSGCVPGGGASNFWTVLLDGNADLSITMTFISTIAAFAMMPMWMMALGSQFLIPGEDQSIQIPYKNIFISLACLAPPLIVGVLINRYLEKFATLIKKILRPFLIFIIIFIVTFGTYANLYMFELMSWRVLLGGLLLPWCGFACGCFAALLTRQTPENVAAIAIETGVQNAGIAIMLLKISFPEPEGDIASAVPVVVSIFTPGPLLLGYSVHFIMKCLKARKESAQKAEGADGVYIEDGPLDDTLNGMNGIQKKNLINGITTNGYHVEPAEEATELITVNGAVQGQERGLL